MTDVILETLGKPQSLKTYVPDRLGHDRRYLLDTTKIKRELGWEPKIKFEDGLKQTIEWYQNNEEWWKHVKSGDYQKYYEDYYKNKIGQL